MVRPQGRAIQRAVRGGLMKGVFLYLRWLFLLLAAFGSLAGCGPNPRMVARAELAPSGELRTAVLFANPVLGSWDTATGELSGLAAEFGRAYALHLGVSSRLIGFSLAELLKSDPKKAWDIALLVEDPARGDLFDFSAPIAEVAVGCLVPVTSAIQAGEEVDRPGVRVAVELNSPIEAHLARSLRYATLVRSGSAKKGLQLLK